MIKVLKNSFTLITLSLFLSACQEEDLYHATSGDDICFDVTLNKDIRGSRCDINRDETFTMINASSEDSLFVHSSISDYSSAEPKASRSNTISGTDAMYDKFSVSAFHYMDSWTSADAASSPDYFIAQTAVLSGNSYQITPQRYWPGEGKIRFLAYAPIGEDAFAFDADKSGKGPSVNISIGEDITAQKDLLVSFSSEIACNGNQSAAPLNFKHALTAVTFSTDKTMIRCVIKSITIKNVYYQGTFYYNMTDASQASSSDILLDNNFEYDELTDRIFTVNIDHELKGSSEEQLTEGENTFLMLPQTLPANAQIEISIQKVDSDGTPIDGAYDTIIGEIGGRVWPAGKIVNYKLSNTDQIFEVSEGSSFNYLGQTYDSEKDTFNPACYITVASHNSAGNIRWNVSYMDEGSDSWTPTSSWLSVDPSWTWSDTASQEVPFKATSDYNAVDIDKNLQNAQSKGSSANPYNLSNSTGASTVENTANSYMVDAPGYYILPLVYGNAYEGGKPNSSAYIYNGSGQNILATFVNHRNKPISAPYIVDNDSCIPQSAALVWQDAQNLVTDISYDKSAFNNKGGIRFYVNPSNIKQGNAVIAIKDKDNVMWSWHIWVTRFDFEKNIELVNQDGNSYTIMPVNLGWCSNGETVRYYPKRECKVKFTPAEGDEALSQTITIVQESHMSFPLGNNPYYQWGRKDPFVGTNIAWGNKPRWDGSGKYYDSSSASNPERLFSDVVEAQHRLTTVEALYLMIENPDKWHNPPAVEGGTSYVSSNKIYDNLWGDISPNAAKTVYDPCPVGYQVDYYYIYTGFLAKGYDWVDVSKINFVRSIASDWNGTDLAEFYTDQTKLKSVIFPVCGYRDWNHNAEVTNFKVEGFCWERGCYKDSDTYMFKYGPDNKTNNVAPVTSFFATDGMPVRPQLMN